MRLYGTVTSERASKGQGGNQLLIDVFDENRMKIVEGEIKIVDGKYHIYISTTIDRETDQCIDYVEETKGNKQKGDNLFKDWNNNLHVNGKKI